MAIPELEIHQVQTTLEDICSRRTIPDEVVVRIEMRGNKVNLVESRRMFIDPREWFDCKVAQLEFTPQTNSWTLYWFDLKNKRHQYTTNAIRLEDRAASPIAANRW